MAVVVVSVGCVRVGVRHRAVDVGVRMDQFSGQQMGGMWVLVVQLIRVRVPVFVLQGCVLVGVLVVFRKH